MDPGKVRGVPPGKWANVIVKEINLCRSRCVMPWG